MFNVVIKKWSFEPIRFRFLEMKEAAEFIETALDAATDKIEIVVESIVPEEESEEKE